MARRGGKGLVCFIVLLLLFFIFVQIMLQTHGSAVPAALASGIVADLREMRRAAWEFFADSMEAALWTSLPDGVTSMDAPAQFFSNYVDNPRKYGEDGHHHTRYRFEIISTDHEVLWRAAVLVSRDDSHDPAVRQKLAARAERAGLLNAQGKPYTSEDNAAYMVWSVGEMLAETLDTKANNVVKRLGDAKKAAFALYAASRDEIVQWDALPEEISPAEATTRYLGLKAGAYRFAIRRTEDGPRWAVGYDLSWDVPEMVKSMIARAEAGGLTDEEGKPYSGGGAVWLRWGLGVMEGDIEARQIIDGLKGVLPELYKLYAEYRDELMKMRSLPEGMSPAEAAAKHLPLCLEPERLAAMPYRLSVADSLLLIGCDVSDGSPWGKGILGRRGYDPSDVRERLRLMVTLEGMDIRNERGEVYAGEDAVYLPWDMTENTPGRWAANCVGNLRGLRKAALMFLADNADKAPRWTALPEGVTSWDAVDRYLGDYIKGRPPHLYLIVTSRDEAPRWLVACRPFPGNAETRRLLAAHAERWNLIEEDGTPYSGGCVVYMAVSFDIRP